MIKNHFDNGLFHLKPIQGSEGSHIDVRSFILSVILSCCVSGDYNHKDLVMFVTFCSNSMQNHKRIFNPDVYENLCEMFPTHTNVYCIDVCTKQMCL